jgi:hypothetical protein
MERKHDPLSERDLARLRGLVARRGLEGAAEALGGLSPATVARAAAGAGVWLSTRLLIGAALGAAR